MENPVIIFGAGSIGKAAMEIFESNDVSIYCFLDDDESLHDTEINNITVLGKTDDPNLLKIIGNKCEAFVAEDDNDLRRSLIEMLNKERKVMPVNGIHNNAVIASTASLGHGNFINAGVQLGAFTEIGNHCILHARATVEHEAKVGDFVQIGAGTVINAGVQIEEGAFIGSGVTIVSGVKIGKGARVGAGSVVIADVKSNLTVFGNPAQAVD